MLQPRLTIVVPCYNEEAVLPKSSAVLGEIVLQLIERQQISQQSQILFVDDGSRDHTWSLIQRLETQREIYSGLKFSRNFGHQNALVAGMQTAVTTSDMIVTIDADLQDDPWLIPQMVAAYQEGNDVVLGVRNDRQSDTRFKRWTANHFYWGMTKLGVQLVPNHADYRLLSQRAVQALLSYSETNLFLRGIIPHLGFPTVKLYYRRQPRLAGESKYTLGKMLQLAINGITSFSVAPLTAILLVGLVLSGCSLLGLVVAAVHSLVVGRAFLGLGTLLLVLSGLGGLQLTAMGLVGTYVGKVLLETKHRPRYIIETDDYRRMPHTAEIKRAMAVKQPAVKRGV